MSHSSGARPTFRRKRRFKNHYPAFIPPANRRTRPHRYPSFSVSQESRCRRPAGASRRANCQVEYTATEGLDTTLDRHYYVLGMLSHSCPLPSTSYPSFSLISTICSSFFLFRETFFCLKRDEWIEKSPKNIARGGNRGGLRCAKVYKRGR